MLRKLNKKVILFLILFFVFISMNTFAFASVDAADNTDFSGQGTSEDPYILNSSNDLVLLSAQVAAGNSFSGAYLQVASNITSLNLSNFIPIGSSSKPFSGSFDGNGTKINITITGASDYRGLFGYVNSTTTVIENFSISGSITGRNYIGGAVGYLQSGTVKNVYNESNITSTGSHVGGIVGWIQGTSSSHATVTNTYNLGDIKATGYVGGLVGYIYNYSSRDYSTVSNSYSAGTVISTNSTYVGGVIGRSVAGSGNRSYLSYDITKIVNCDSISTTKPSTLAVTVDGVTGLTTDQLTSSYMTSKLDSGWTIGSISGSSATYPQLNEFANSSSSIVKNNSINSVTTSIINGTGSTAYPFYIRNATDFSTMKTRILDGNTFEGFCFAVEEGITSFDLDNFVPIGTRTHPFYGSFDGNDAVFDLAINSTIDYVGLFGYFGKGTIKNLSVTGSVTGKSYVGAIVGYQLSGTIENVYNEANVTSTASFAGGIVGRFYTGIISTAYNAGNITATSSYAGGIVGYVDGNSSAHATVTNTYNKGEVIASSYAGGLVGCTYSYSSYDYSTISYSYSAGLVSANTYAGGVIGQYNVGSGYRNYIYYDMSVISLYEQPKTLKPAYITDTYGLSTSRLTSTDSPMTYFSSTNWSFKEAAYNTSYYPQLKVFSENSVSRINLDSVSSVSKDISDGDGSSATPFIIRDSQDMVDLARKVNAGNTYLGYYFKIADGVDEIVLSSFIPIGTSSHPFSGSFNGNACNFNISISSTADYKGLFGYVSANTAIIENFSISGSITGRNYIGAAVAYLYSGTVTNIYNTANITATGNHVGGIVGYVQGVSAAKAIVTKTYNQGEIVAAGYVGGIVGSQWAQSSYKYSTISYSYSAGLVCSIDSSFVGGVVGYFTASSGYRSFLYYDITRIVNYDKTASTKPSTSPVAANGIYGLTSGQMISSDMGDNLPSGWTFKTKSAAYGYYPQLTIFENNEASTISSRSLESVKLSIGDGVGTSDFPFIIKSESDLTDLKSKLTLGNTFEGFYFIVNDGVTLFNLENFEPIGTPTHPFYGSFDGNDAVFNLAITSSTDYIGLFGYFGKGTIKNLSITGSVKGRSYVGSVAGYQLSGTIENVYNLADITASSSFGGGLVGRFNTGIIKNVYNKGNVTVTTNYAGGIAGYVDGTSGAHATLTNSYNRGEIIAGGYVGGLVGCTYSYSSYDYSTISYSYSAGLVSGNSYVGGVIGQYTVASGNKIHIYYDMSLIALYDQPKTTKPDYITNVYGLSTSDLISKVSPMTYFDSDSWTFITKTTDVGYYPQLNVFSTSDVTQISSNSLLSVTVDISDGVGTSDMPFLIENSDDMFEMARKVNAGNTYVGYYFKVADGIDEIVLANFTPIGTTTHVFSGSFDGNETNFNITIDGTSDYRGIFGYVKGKTAVVKNFSISGSITGRNYIGGAVGYLYSGIVENIYNEAKIIATGSHVGGIVGWVQGSSSEHATVTNTYNQGEINAASYVGGIVGYVYNYSSYDWSTISNSYSAGYISSYNSSYVGGVIGRAIAGSGNRSNLYYDITRIVNYDKAASTKPSTSPISVDGVYGLTSGQMISDYMASRLVSGWTLKSKVDEYGYYPQLSSFENNDLSAVKATSLKSVMIFIGDGLGTKDLPFLVKTNTDLDNIKTKLVAGNTFEGFYFVVDEGITSFDLDNFVSIGTKTHPFYGSFDGNDAEFNVAINSTSDYIGLFGYFGKGTICNLSVTGSIKGRSYVGGIAGYQASGTIENVYNLADITSTSSFVGGIVGRLLSGEVKNVYNDGDITATSNYAGGIIGYIDGSSANHATVTNSYNRGEIIAGSYVGGLVGCTYSYSSYDYSTISYSYSAGLVSGNSYVGGVIGQFTAASGYRVHIYYDMSLIALYEQPKTLKPAYIKDTYGLSTSSLISEESPMNNFSESNWTFIEKTDDNGYYPQLNVFSSSEISRISAKSLSSVTIDISGGVGNEDMPFLIENSDDMFELARKVNAGNTYVGYYFKVADDIDEIELSSFIPIGTTSHYFSGTFDGNGVNFETTITTTTDYHGIFGYVRGTTAVVKNFSISGTIKGRNYLGSAVAYLYSGTVNNIYNEASIIATGSHVGGIVGWVQGSSSEHAKVTNTYNQGIINAASYVGGIVGYVYNYSSYDWSTISYSYSAGYVSSYNSSYAGGVIGRAIAGSGNRYNLYYDITRTVNYDKPASTKPSTSSIVVDGVHGLTSGQLISDYMNDILGTSWTFKEKEDDNGYYPQLTIFVENDIEAIQTRSLDSVTIFIGDGLGTEDLPFIIKNTTDLNTIKTKLDAGNTFEGFFFVVDEEVDSFDLENFVPIGTSSHPFYGSFDGNNAVFDLAISTTTDYKGLFGYFGKGTIKNLSVTGTVKGRNYVGGIVGYQLSGTIENVYNLADITSTGSFVGGIVGRFYNGIIKNVYNTGDVTATSNYAGGIVGYVDGTRAAHATVTNAYNRGEIIAGGYVGGLIGCTYSYSSYDYSTISYSYSSGLVSGNSYVGGVIGQYTVASGYKTHIYYDVSPLINYEQPKTTKPVTTIGGYAVSKTSMFESNMEDLGFSSLDWEFKNIEGNYAYFPQLKVFSTSENELVSNQSLLSVRTNPFLGDGTKASPFLILTAQDMVNLSNSISSDYDAKGIYYLVGEGVNYFDLEDTDFVIIGSNSVPFMGSFDGNYATFNVVLSGTDYVGLFGYLGDEAEVKRLAVSGEISGENYVGSIAGYSLAPISEVYSTATVDGQNNIGGLVGYLANSLTNAYHTNDVSGDSNVGGLVGTNNGAVSQVYVGARVTGTTNVGAIIGNETGSINFAYYDKTIIEYHEHDENEKPTGAIGNGSDLAQVKGYDKKYMKALGILGTGENQLQLSTDFWVEQDTSGLYDFYPQLTAFKNHLDTTIQTASEMSARTIRFATGTGSKTSPYMIQNADDMKAIASISLVEDLYNIYFKVEEGIEVIDLTDIDLNYTSIGPTLARPFRGGFDGSGTNFILNISNGNAYQGLFGVLKDGADIKNIEVSGSVHGYSYIGGVTGYADSALITNVKNSALISGFDYVGGIAGKADNCTIQYAYNEGTVTGTRNYSGGIVGYTLGSTIDTAYNFNVITGVTYVGGITGLSNTGSSITNVYNRSNIFGTSNYIGGITGYLDESTLEQSYSAGMVRGSDEAYLGGLIGRVNGVTLESDSYYDATIVEADDFTTLANPTRSIGNKLDQETVKGLGKTSLSGESDLTLDSNVWTFTANDGVNAYYPQLTYFETSTDETVKENSLLSVTSYIFAGEGVIESPYIIVDAQDMALLSDLVNSGTSFTDTYFRVRKDAVELDMSLSGLNYKPIGSSINPFNGNFDGSGTDFIMSMDSSLNEVGLFGHVSTEGIITNLSVSGEIKGQDYVGSVVGINEGSITEVYSTAKIYGQSYAGGIAGKNSGEINLIYARGYVEGNQYVGGLVGYNDGNISNGYVVSEIYGKNDLGGIVGSETINGHTTFAYYNEEYVDLFDKSGYTIPLLAISNKNETTTLYGVEKAVMVSGSLGTDNNQINFEDLSYWQAKAPYGFSLYYPQLTKFSSSENDLIVEASLDSIKTSRFTEGDGSEEHPYVIRSASDMKGISDLILSKDTLSDTYFIVADDVKEIDLTDSELGYIPIGNGSYQFQGNFNGNGTRFVLDVSSTAYYQGLFGYIGAEGSVYNLSVEGSVSGTYFAGGIAGRNAGYIYNVYNLADVLTTVYYAGGIVGYNDGIIENSYNAGHIVSNSYYAGGITGRTTRNTSIQYSYNVGLVEVVRSYAGGIVGYSDGNVYQTYNAGIVVGSGAGAIVGTNTAFASTNNSYYDYSKLILTDLNRVATKAIGNQDDTESVFGVNKSQITGDDIYNVALDFDYFILKANVGYDAYYPQLKVFNQSDDIVVKTDSITSVTTNLFSGLGTEESPYLIIDGFDLKALSLLTSQGINVEGVYFTIYEEEAVIDISDSDLYYIPIGTVEHPFSGYFLGNKGTINLGIDSLNEKQGVFGVTSSAAEISDLYLSGTVSGGDVVGSLVGTNYGLIRNVISYAEVKGKNIVGGLVGENNGTINLSASKADIYGTDNTGGLAGNNAGNITNSYHMGLIRTTGQMTGGLVGYNQENAEISSCFNNGEILTDYIYTGGLVGFNEGLINKAYYTGNLTSKASYVAGITSINMGVISNVYIAGEIYGDGNVAGIVIENNGSLENLYYDTTYVEESLAISGLNTPLTAVHATEDTSRVKGLSHDEMTGFYSVGTYDHQIHFEMDEWVERDGYDFVTYYPEMASFNELENEEMVQDSLDSVTSRKINGEGTSVSPYVIYDVSDMYIFKSFVENEHTFEDKYFKVADGVQTIDLSDDTSEFSPIGTTQFYFGGNFDGNGVNFVLDINEPLSEYMGLFHTLSSTATVRNFEISGSIVGESYVGSAAGRNMGTIENVVNYASISSLNGNDIGGIVGFNEGTIKNATNIGQVKMNGTYAGGITGQNTGTITYSYNHGNITGLTLIGGIVGRNLNIITYTYNMANITAENVVGGIAGENISGIDHSFNHGDIIALSSTAGGLIGSMNQISSKATLSVSYNTGFVSSEVRLAGGLVANLENGTIYDCYSGGVVESMSDLGALVGQIIGGSISRSYYDVNTIENYNYKLVSTEKAIGNNEDTATVKGLFHGQMAGANPIGSDATQMSFYYSSSFVLASSYDEWSFYPQLDGFAYSEDDLVVTDSIESVKSKTFVLGSGTEVDPFVITNEADMIALAQTTISGNDYDGVYFVVNADGDILDFTNVDVNKYISIGNEENQFNGHFDGEGTHFILDIDETEDYQGLFGYIGSAGYVGNVSVSGTIIGGSYTAGISGYNEGLVEKVYNQANILGNDYTGGLTGYSLGVIQNAYNRGEVIGANYTGGITGYCDGTIEYTYNTGVVYGQENVGALVGFLNTDLVTYSYYDSTILRSYTNYSNLIKPTAGVSNSIDSDTVKGLDKSFMTGTIVFGTSVFSMNFTEMDDVWTTTYNIGDETYYPQLKVFSKSYTPGIKTLSKESAQTQLYKITYDYRGATEDDEIIYTYAMTGYNFDTPVGFKMGFEFTGWYFEDDLFNKIQYTDSDGVSLGVFDLEEDISLFATWEVAKHIVSFVDGNGQILEQIEVVHGDVVSEITQIPGKDPSATTIYFFDTWDFDFTSRILEETSIEANYLEINRYYKATYFDGDGEYFQEVKVEFGHELEASTEVPTKTFVDNTAYKFLKWDFDFTTTITGNVEIYPIFTSVDRYYSVRFFNGDGSVIETQVVEYLDHASIPSVKITKESTISTEYIFSGFEDKYRVIEGDVDIYPIFIEKTRTYQITFLDGNSDVFSTQEVLYGETASEPVGVPLKNYSDDDAYKFIKWNINYEPVESDEIIVAIFETVDRYYDITFLNTDGSVLKTEVVEYLLAATAPTTEEQPTKDSIVSHIFTFIGWDSEFSLITADLTISPVFEKTLRPYTVTFLDGNGEVFEIQEVLYGTDAVPTVDPPRKDGVGQIGYKFVSWSNLTNIVADRTVTSNYTPVDRYYILNFYSYDMTTLLSTENVEYGFAANVPDVPVKPHENISSEYVFTSWSEDVNFVSKNANVYPLYDEQLKSFTVTFVYGDEITTQEVSYGESAIAPATDTISTDQFTKTFSSWDVDFSFVTEDITVTALFDEIYDYCIVKFYNGDGSVVSTQHVAYLGSAVLPDADITKESTASTTYTFIGFEDIYENVTGNVDVYPKFTEQIRTFQVVFKDGNGDIFDVQEIVYGENAVKPTELPTKTYVGSVAYKFIGWNGSYENVESDLVIESQFMIVDRYFTVTFLDQEGLVSLTEVVEFLSAANGPETDPFKESTVSHIYPFTGWSSDISSVTSDLTVTPIFEESLRPYTVTFLDGNGDLFNAQVVLYGNDAVVPEGSPRKDGVGEIGYKFVSWSDYSNVLSDRTVTPTYTEVERYHIVTFYNFDGSTILGSQKIEYGFAATAPNAPVRVHSNISYEYVFTGWSAAFDFVEENISTYAQYTASLKVFTVTFIYGDETLTQEVSYGHSASAPDPSRDGDDHVTYTFTGWDNSYSSITEDVTITALYDEAYSYFIVKFYDGDGLVIKSEQVNKGESATEPLDNPTKDKTLDNMYIFVNWDKSFDSVDSDLDVYSLFNEVDRYYDVTFYDEHDLVLSTQVVEYGQDAIESTIPSKDDTEQYRYTFTSWTESITNITSDLDIYPLFKEEIRTFVVNFVNGDGEIINTQTIEYGKSAIVSFEATKTNTDENYYIFDGWDASYASIKSDIDINAVFTFVDRYYTVTFYDKDLNVLNEQIIEYLEGAIDPIQDLSFEIIDTDTIRAITSWDKEFNTITSDLDVNAIYTTIDRYYTVSFYHSDGTLISSETVEYGSEANAPTDPIKSSTDTYRYEFTGWSLDYSFVTANLAINAEFDEITNNYTIIFYDGNGDVFDTQVVHYLEDAIAPDGIATKVPTEQTMFAFSGWDVDFTGVTEDLEVHATFDEQVRTFLVRFVNESGNLIKEEYVLYGTAAVAPDDFTIPESTEMYEYIPSWDVDFDFITESIQVQLQFEETIRNYTYTFYGEFDEILKTVIAEYGSIITPPVTPTKEMTEKYVYTFTAWSPEIVYELTGDVEYHATFEEELRLYTVTFIDGNGDYFDEIEVAYGGTGEVPSSIPTKDGTYQYYYEFTYWQVEPVSVKRDMTIPALFNRYLEEYKVTFIDLEGNILKQTMVEYGTGVTEPETELIPNKSSTSKYSYMFAGWSRPFGNVTEDMVVQTVYISVLRTYSYTFYDYDQVTILKEIRAVYDSKIIPPDDPTREGTNLIKYEFIGWDKVVANTLTQDIIYYATYEEMGKTYDVLFYDGNGSLYEVQKITYGHPASSPTTPPTKTSEKIYDYIFSGWIEDYSNITEDLEVHPTFVSQLRKYSITFVSYDDSQTVIEIEYGKSAVGKIVTPYRPGYRFVEWDKDITYVTENFSTKAVFTSNSYFVTFHADDADSGSMESLVAEYDSDIDIPINSFERIGYYFGGWKLDPDTDEVVYSDEDSFVLEQEGIELYSEWIPIIYSIDYILDGGVAVNPTQYTIEDQINLQEALKEDYKFEGWYVVEVNVSDDGTTSVTYTTNEAGETITVIDPGNIGNITLKAIYKYDGYIQLKEESNLGLFNAEIETTIPIYERVEYDEENPIYLIGVFLGQTIGNLRENFINENLVFVDLDGNELTDDMVVATSYQIIIRDEDDDSMVKDRIHIVLKGDTNGDGRITTVDTTLIKNYINKSEQLIAARILASDLNGDGRITSVDVGIIKNHINGVDLIYDASVVSTLGGEV